MDTTTSFRLNELPITEFERPVSIRKNEQDARRIPQVRRRTTRHSDNVNTEITEWRPYQSGVEAARIEMGRFRVSSSREEIVIIPILNTLCRIVSSLCALNAVPRLHWRQNLPT